MSNLITNYNVNIGGVKQDLGTIIQNNSTQTINISTSGLTNSVSSLCFNPNGQQVIYDNSIYPSMSGSSVNGNTAISFGAKKRYGDNGMWVAVGQSLSTIAYSSDGINWTGLGKSIFSIAGYGVAWNGTLWVAVGGEETNTIAYSYDGINWTGLGKSIFTTTGRGVAWNGTLWVAVGSGTNEIAYSSDGINWTGVTGTSASIFDTCKGVAWNGTRWVAVGSGTYTIAYSSDGKKWSPVINSKTNIFSIECRGVAWNGTLWVAVGYGSADPTSKSIAYSSDGITWSTVTDSRNIFGFWGWGVAWNGTRFVAVGEGGTGGTYSIAYSSDGINWTGVTDSKTNILSTGGFGVAWNGTRFVAVGQGGGCIAYSSDGITWSPVTGSTSPFSGIGGCGISWGGSNLPNTITFPRNLTIAVGLGTNSIAYSSGGSNNWVGVTGSNSIFSTGRGVAWNGTIWVAVGVGTSFSIAYSQDGSNNWTGVTGSKTIFSTAGYGVAWNGTIWVAVGEGITNSIAYSYDGITWTGVTSSNNIFSDYVLSVEWNGTRWVAVGQGTSNTIAYSFDGITWVGVTGSKSNIFSTYCRGIAWNGTKFVSVGQGTNFSIAYSSDGINWTGVTGSISSIFSQGNGIAWNGTQFVAVGYGTAYTIAYSSDGINWTPVTGSRTFFTTGYNITWNGIVFVAVGEGTNKIAYSSDGINWLGISSSIFTTGYGVAYNKNIPSVKIQHPTIAVGSGTNSIAYSSDSINWSGLGNTIFGTNGIGNSVLWNGIRWVAVGSGTNSIAYSSDGISWFGLGNTIFTIGNGIGWNGKIWVAVGSGTSGSIAYSSDGIKWNIVTSSNTMLSIGFSVSWNGKMWVAVGSGSGTNSIVYSTNGIVWVASIANLRLTSSILLPSNTAALAYNGSQVFAINNKDSSAYSSDGIYWNTGNLSSNTSLVNMTINDIIWDNTRWIAVGDNGSGPVIAYLANSTPWTSPGTNWTIPTIPAGTGITSLKSVACNNPKTLWMACGSNSNNILSSTNGTSWSQKSVTTSSSIPILTSVCDILPLLWPYPSDPTITMINRTYACGTKSSAYVTAGVTYSGIAYSDLSGNTDTWIAEKMKTSEAGVPLSQVNTIAYDRWTGATIAGGIPGPGSTNSLMTRVDNTGWRVVPSTTGSNWYPGASGGSMFGIVENIAWDISSGWVIVGSPPAGANINSQFTIAFATRASGGCVLTGIPGSSLIFNVSGKRVRWAGDKWIATGNGTSNTIAYSYDGLKWFAANSNGPSTQKNSSDMLNPCRSVAYNNTQWVAVGSPDVSNAGTTTIASSTDGINWNPIANSSAYTNLNDIAWNGTNFVAVGKDATSGVIINSVDGVNNWTKSSTSIFTDCSCISWNGTKWFAGGYGGSGTTYSIAYSFDGSNNWVSVPNSNKVLTTCAHIAGNPKVGATIVPSAIHLNNNLNSNSLTFSSESYYQSGVNNISIDVNTM